MSCIGFKTALKAQDKNDCFDNSHVAREGGKRFAFDNRTGKSICRVRVDNCLIMDQQKKCDYLFKIETPAKYYLVELKGVNVADGIRQIINTYEIVNSKIKATAQDYSGILVSSSVPNAANQTFRRLKEKCFREKKLSIRKTHMQHIEPI